MQTLTLGDAVYTIYPRTCIEITFPEAQIRTSAAPNHDAASVERARELGHADVWEMTVFHELAHTIAALAMGAEHSKVLYGAALKAAGIGTTFHPYWATEEKIAFSLTSYALRGEWKHWLPSLGINTGTYLDILGWHLNSRTGVLRVAEVLRGLAAEVV